ncbi:GNAT family N-acetyltransferase [Cytobacillus massiliigabonensis]|uniref:GNAT family N-acetyltransferase n=1 Tax=Cytobacillus massiliigabonensis TaxID=1871011 RepID=UPI000C83337A|nr:GNAT family N-acetyltransferase [Cytobacillus massiliigabonensis]
MTVVLNENLAHRIEQSEIDALHSRLSAVQGIFNNPMDVQIEKFGNATAFTVKMIPGPSFNTVKGLADGDERYIDDIIDFYNKRNIPARFELTPANVSPELLTILSEKGFYQKDFHSSLYTSALPDQEPEATDIAIRRLNKNEFDLFADIYIKSFGLPDFVKEGIAQNNAVLYGFDNWTFYLAAVEDEPAGIGVIFVQDKISTLAAAATIPQFRNKGVHQALIHKCLQHAAFQTCDLAVGQAKYASISQNNMERAGMKIAYTKAIWVQRES